MSPNPKFPFFSLFNCALSKKGVTTATTTTTQSTVSQVPLHESTSSSSSPVKTDQQQTFNTEQQQAEDTTNLSPLDRAHFDIFVKPTMEEDTSEVADQSPEHKAIPATRESVQIDQENFVTRQIHSELLDQERSKVEESLMSSSNIPDREEEEEEQHDMDEIKRVASDFVKSLSDEALEKVNEMAQAEESQEEEAEEDKRDEDDLPVPKVKIMFSTELSDSELKSDMDEVRQELEVLDTRQTEPVSSVFYLQSSFRSHFVNYFTEEEASLIDTGSFTHPQEAVADGSEGFDAPDNIQHQPGSSAPGYQQDLTGSGSSSKPAAGNLMDDSEDIWAGEDIVVLRKSMSHMKSVKSDSESQSSEIAKQASASAGMKSDRQSGTDFESGGWTTSSGTGEAYQTAHGSGSASSRPSSSDVEAMLSAVSGRGSSLTTTTTEYQTANSHTGGDMSQHSSSQDYHTAASTLTSFKSDGSGHLASFEHSETSDTLIDVSLGVEQERDAASTPYGAPEEAEGFVEDNMAAMAMEKDEEVIRQAGVPRTHEMYFKDATTAEEEPLASSSSKQEEQNIYESKETLASIHTISTSGSEATVVTHEQQPQIAEVVEPAEVMQQSVTSSTTTTSEKAVHSVTPHTESGELLGSIEELKKDESPVGQQRPASGTGSDKDPFLSRVVSFDASTFAATDSPTVRKQQMNQKSFDSEFGSRPESELKDFESRPHSISDAMYALGDSPSIRPDSKSDVSDTEMDHLKKEMEPFVRPITPEPPNSAGLISQESPDVQVDLDQDAKTEMAFNTHFTQVMEETPMEYEKLEEVPEFQVMTAVEIEDDGGPITQAKLRGGTQSLDLGVASYGGESPMDEASGKPSHWPASSDLIQEDDGQIPVDKTSLHLEEVSGAKEISPGGNEDDDEAYASGAFPYNPPLDQIIEEEEETAATEEAQQLKQLKESLSNAPDFDRKALALKLGEKEASSYSSLTEFEVLEKEVALRGSGSGSRGSLGSQDSLESGPAKPTVLKKAVAVGQKHSGNVETASHGSSGSLQEFEQMEEACKDTEQIEHMARFQQEVVLSEIEEGHESQISESESCETLSQGGKSDDSTEFNQRMQQIDEIIRQAQTNVEIFDRPTYEMTFGKGAAVGTSVVPPPVTEVTSVSGIMEASTDSLEPMLRPEVAAAGGDGSMVASSDSLEDKLAGRSPPSNGNSNSNNTDDLMKISTDSIENNGASGTAAVVNKMMLASTDSIENGNRGAAGQAQIMITSTDSIEGALKGPVQMIASTDSLDMEMSASGVSATSTATKGATASMLSSCTSTSETLVSDTDSGSASDTSGLKKYFETSLGQVVEAPDEPTTVTTAQCRVSYGYNISEVYLPEGGVSGEGSLTSTIERTVEMPAEVTRVQFSGPEAEAKMRQYMAEIGGNDNVRTGGDPNVMQHQELESVDASGNVIHKKVIQKGVFGEPEP